MVAFDRNPQDFKYLRLLSRQFPTEQSAFTEIINLSAILNLPKGTEHFMSDLHGEYEAFMHILNNCSGVVREHVDEIFGDMFTFDEKGELCTLIYYPREKIELVRSQHEDSPTWYKTMLNQLIVVARSLSSRYTRSKVRKAIPRDYAYIIDELLHTHPDENNYRVRYHERIVESILRPPAPTTLSSRLPRSSSAWPSTTCTWWATSSTAAAARPRLWTACSPTIRSTSSGAITTCCGWAPLPASPPASPRCCATTCATTTTRFSKTTMASRCASLSPSPTPPISPASPSVR